MILEHLDVVVSRLRAHADLSAIVFDEKVPAGSTKYVAVYTNPGSDDEARLSGPTVRTEFTYTIHSVGASKRQALWVAERVRAQLVNFRPTVEGRSCGRLQHPVSRPVTADTSSNPALWYTVDQFDLASFPA